MMWCWWCKSERDFNHLGHFKKYNTDKIFSVFRFPHFCLPCLGLHPVQVILLLSFKNPDAEEPLFNDNLLPTAYVVRGKVMFWILSVRLSVHGGVPHLARSGGTPARSRRGGGGTPSLDRGGTPIQPWTGVSPSSLGWGGTPSSLGRGGYQMGVPPSQVVPPSWYRTTDGALDTPRSVCLLRSRRRTCSFLLWHWHQFHKSCFITTIISNLLENFFFTNHS